MPPQTCAYHRTRMSQEGSGSPGRNDTIEQRSVEYRVRRFLRRQKCANPWCRCCRPAVGSGIRNWHCGEGQSRAMRHAPPQLRGAWWASGGDSPGQTNSSWGCNSEIVPQTSDNMRLSNDLHDLRRHQRDPTFDHLTRHLGCAHSLKIVAMSCQRDGLLIELGHHRIEGAPWLALGRRSRLVLGAELLPRSA